MISKLIEIPVKTNSANELVDVTAQIQRLLTGTGIKEGILVAHVMHTTAAITINENADPDVVHDVLLQLGKISPDCREFKHGEGNSDAHVKASLVGNSVTIPVSQGRLVLGTWQGVYFCEFDGPRARKLIVRVLGE
jgi:secondary thiamine-phosphate synthase enzyme